MINNDTEKMISIGAYPAPKLDIWSTESEGEIIHVYDASIIRILSQALRMPFKIHLFPNGEHGAKTSDGNWTGGLGMLRRSEVDILFTTIISYQRFLDFNFSYPYIFSDATFMTDKLKPDPTGFALLQPFPLILWILLTAAIFLFSFVLFMHMYREHSYQNILFMLFGSLLEKSIDVQLRKLSLKLLVSSWLIFIFVIINSYKAVILSILTLPPLSGIRDISSLGKAAEQNSITCYSYKGTAFQQNLLESEFATWRSIGKCMQRNVIDSEDIEAAFVKAPSRKAFITKRSYLRPYEEMFYISEDSFYNDMPAFPISRNFCCLSYLNDKIHQLFEAGMFQKIEKDEAFFLKLKRTFSDSEESGRLKVIQLEDIKGAFVVLLSGYVLSTIVLFIEIPVKHFFPKLNVTRIKRKRNILKKRKKRWNRKHKTRTSISDLSNAFNVEALNGKYL